MNRTLSGYAALFVSGLAWAGCSSSGGYIDKPEATDAAVAQADLRQILDFGVIADLRKTPRTELSFAAPVTYPTQTAAYNIAVGRIDLDDQDDLLVGGQPGATVYLSAGNGKLLPIPLSLLAGWQVAIADMNRDGKGDLLLTDTAHGTISIVLGNGDGSFRSPISVPAGKVPTGVASADLNGDGIPDLLSVEQDSAQFYAYLGNGDGSVMNTQTLPIATGGSPQWIATGDVNGDKRVDAVVSNFGTASLSLFVGKGDGTFLAAQQIPTIASPCDVEIVDLNLDGKLDIAVNGLGADKAVAVHLGDGVGGFRPLVKYSYKNIGGIGLHVADLNADGWPELITATPGVSPAHVFLGAGDGTFLPEQTFDGGANNPFNVRAVDLNRDGRPDLVLSEASAGKISVLLNTTPPPTM